MEPAAPLRNLSDYLNLSQIEATAVVLDVCFVASTVLFPIVVYLVFYEKSMGKYRWFILNGIVWDYAYDVLMSLMKPVLFLPCIGGYSQSIFKFPQWSGPVFVLVGASLIINCGWSTTVSMMYRFSQSSTGKIMEFFDKARGVYVFYAFLNVSWHLVFEGMLIGGSFHASASSDKAADIYADWQHFRDVNIHFIFLRTPGTTLFLVTLSGSLLIFLGCGVVLWAVLLYRLRRSSAKKMKSYRLQTMLFRAFSAQMALGYFCMLVPLLTTVLLIAMESTGAQTAGNAYLMLSSTHAVLDSIAVLYFVTPYRRRLIKHFRTFQAYVLRPTLHTVTIVGVGQRTATVNIADSPTLTTL